MRLYEIRHKNKPIGYVCADSKWHAVDKVFYSLNLQPRDRRRVKAVLKKI